MSASKQKQESACIPIGMQALFVTLTGNNLSPESNC